ncbi:MAG: hypothetical protein DWH78_08135 [Planctomycetota bacterium]|nr:MAG: hypothetical protein DWH78_08135 [Planctomycetota bacterium]
MKKAGKRGPHGLWTSRSSLFHQVFGLSGVWISATISDPERLSEISTNLSFRVLEFAQNRYFEPTFASVKSDPCNGPTRS